MEIIIVIGLLLLGIVFFIIEGFLIPGITIAGIVGGILTIAAVWYAYTYIGNAAGHLALGGGIALIGLSIWGFARSKTLDRMSLKTNVDSKVESIDEEAVKAGDTGTTISRLAPMGKVKINGKTLEAKTADDFIDPDEKIVVKEVYKTNVLVERI